MKTGAHVVERDAPGREFRRDRCKYVASLERETGLSDIDGCQPVCVETTNPVRFLKDRREKPIIRREENMLVFLRDDDFALRPDARINDSDMHRAIGKVGVGAAQPEAGLGWPVCWNVMGEVDNSRIGKATDDYSGHHCGERAFVAKIGGDGDYARRVPVSHGTESYRPVTPPAQPGPGAAGTSHGPSR